MVSRTSRAQKPRAPEQCLFPPLENFGFRKIWRTLGVPTSWCECDLLTTIGCNHSAADSKYSPRTHPSNRNPSLSTNFQSSQLCSAQLSFVARVRPPSPPAEPVNQRKARQGSSKSPENRHVSPRTRHTEGIQTGGN